MSLSRLKQAAREALRWRILAVCYAAGNLGVDDKLIVQVVNESGGATDIEELRQEMAYLEGKDLIEVDRGRSYWRAALTPTGVDVKEGTVPCPPGVACQHGD